MVTAQRLARSIVRDSLRPAEYESVIISTYPHTSELAEEIALECQRVGADPLVVLDTDRIFYGQFKNYSDENLRRTSAHCVGMADYVRSYVWLGGPKDPGPMARVPSEKFAAMYAGEQAHYEKNLEKRNKSVGVALGQVTRERAKTYGFNYNAWKAMIEAAIAVNYKRLTESAAKVATLLSKPGDVHITADNGTDFRFRLLGPGRRVEVDDGVIGEDDLASASPSASLPAGSVWVAPDEDSAWGTIVADVGIPQVGKLIQGLSWTFKDGRVVEFTAKKNVQAAQVNYQGGVGGRGAFGSFALGLNRKAKPGFLQNNVVAGTVTVGIGDNRQLGGKISADYGFLLSLARGDVEIDGKTVVADGKWVA